MKTFDDRKENFVLKLIKEYAIGFKKIFTNSAAFLVLLGIVCRIWETAISSNFLSAYMKCYTDDPLDE
jgi:hypothetical protein